LDFGSVENFWAAHGTEGPVLCFAGHTDVVPTGPLEEWRTDPFKPVVDGRALRTRRGRHEERPRRHGHRHRGLRAPTPDHKGTIAFLITSDEEGPSVDGTKRVVETLRHASSASTGASSASPRARRSPATRSRSAGAARSGRLTVHGVQGHMAYPQLAKNPVHMLAPALAELTRVWDQGNEHFQPTTFQISNLNAGTGAPNVIPGELKARFNLRYSPVQTSTACARRSRAS
jgi:succinyl-diaminopimelate desuccinylase